ncbi:MAG: hypothetical protein Kow0058_00140 [Roseovarius sp.]
MRAAGKAELFLNEAHGVAPACLSRPAPFRRACGGRSPERVPHRPIGPIGPIGWPGGRAAARTHRKRGERRHATARKGQAASAPLSCGREARAPEWLAARGARARGGQNFM